MAFGREIKVGLFVLVGLLVLGGVVFLIGDERRLFDRHVSFRSSFSDVQGLKAGAPVRMDGIDIGSVTSVSHAEDLNDARIHVQMSLVRSEAMRLRSDSFAKISNKGLLGDKMIELVPGGGQARSLTDTIIRGQDPTDFTNLFTEVGSITHRADVVLGNLEKVSKALAEEKLQEDFRSSAHSVSLVLKQIAEGNGYIHRLLVDPTEAEHLSSAISSIDRTSSELAVAATEVRLLAARMNQGPGFIHDVVYSQDGSKAVTQFGRAADELAVTLKGVREGNGLAKGVLYGDSEQQQIVGNINTISSDVRDIVAGVKAGRGTLGALLVDPSVYEDMKMLLGNVQRNEVLRALVRYSIKQDEKKPEVQIRDSK